MDFSPQDWLTQRDQDEVGVEEEEALQGQLQEDGKQPEPSQLGDLLGQVPEVAEIEADQLNYDDSHDDGDEDKLVEIVEEVILDGHNHDGHTEPEREVYHVEV